MPRNSSNSRRSGRFVNKEENAGTVKIITLSFSDRLYRFHNTDRKDAANLQVTSRSRSASIPPGGSVDLLVARGEEVTVGPGRGVYDLLTDHEVVRSGAFAGATTIADLGSESRLYRIINSSESNIVVAGETITPESSLDIVLTGLVQVTGDSPEGIFDLLGAA